MLCDLPNRSSKKSPSSKATVVVAVVAGREDVVVDTELLGVVTGVVVVTLDNEDNGNVDVIDVVGVVVVGIDDDDVGGVRDKISS